MENFLRPYDKEYMRMAMLKHEETFKEQQVSELHRLYQVQKKLMKDFDIIRESVQNQEIRWEPKNGKRLNQTNDHYTRHQKPIRHIDLERPAEEYLPESEVNGVVTIEDESEIELTLGPKCYYGRRKEERPLISDSTASFCSSSSGSSHKRRAGLVFPESPCKKIEESIGQNWGLLELHEANVRFPREVRNSSNGEEQFRQDGVKQPLWLFQTLSLNIT